jgi:hypothetical protein
MGSSVSTNQHAKKVGYQELGDSVVGFMVPENDFDLFYSFCKVETVRTISTLLHPSPSQIFYVVVSGEVTVHLTAPHLKQRSVIATTFCKGEVIHFFNLKLRSVGTMDFDFGECLQNGGIKLALHFKSTPNNPAKVIGIDKKGMDDYLRLSRANTQNIRTFYELNLVEIAKTSSFFKSISEKQVSLLPL